MVVRLPSKTPPQEAEIRCTRMRRTRFIDRDIVFDIQVGADFGPGKREERRVQLREEFRDLGAAFFRNHVEAHFVYAWEDRNRAPFVPLKERIRDFCEENLEGYWSWKISTKSEVSTSNREERQKVILDLYFERETDLDVFLKDCGLLLKLAN